MRDTYDNIPREKAKRVAAVYRPDRDGHITLLSKPEYLDGRVEKLILIAGTRFPVQSPLTARRRRG
jgi:hypothetical protein